MGKLALNLDDLAVESFATLDEGRSRGTVMGHDDTSAPLPICACVEPSWPTEQPSCRATCDESACYGTCHVSCEGGSCGLWCEYTDGCAPNTQNACL